MKYVNSNKIFYEFSKKNFNKKTNFPSVSKALIELENLLLLDAEDSANDSQNLKKQTTRLSKEEEKINRGIFLFLTIIIF